MHGIEFHMPPPTRPSGYLATVAAVMLWPWSLVFWPQMPISSSVWTCTSNNSLEKKSMHTADITEINPQNCIFSIFGHAVVTWLQLQWSRMTLIFDLFLTQNLNSSSLFKDVWLTKVWWKSINAHTTDIAETTSQTDGRMDDMKM